MPQALAPRCVGSGLPAGSGGHQSDPLDPADCRLALDRSTPVPLWAQIADYLVAAIGDHRLASGQSIGTEEELAQRFSVSRATIRKALATIAARGLITRSRGTGTRVELGL